MRAAVGSPIFVGDTKSWALFLRCKKWQFVCAAKQVTLDYLCLVTVNCVFLYYFT
jgi:hypothetical protein